MTVCLRWLFLIVLLLSSAPLSAQVLNDPRLDPEVVTYIQRNPTVPVMIAIDGRASEVRETWRLIVRALDGRYGVSDSPPNRQREVFAELNRFGLMLVLNFEQVREIYLPFEFTRPGD